MSDGAVQHLADIEDLKQLKARYWRYLDTKDWKAWRELFADDLHFQADTFSGDGADEIVAFISKALTGAVTVHQGHTSEITLTGPDTATGIWSFSDWVTHPPASDGSRTGFRGHGHYHDEYVRTPEGWRLKRSVVTRLRVDPAEP